MKKTFKKIGFATMAIAMITGTFSCSKDDEIVEESAGVNEAYTILGIPSDEEATEAPEIVTPTVTLPNSAVTLMNESGFPYLAINMTGIWDDQASEWLRLVGTANKSEQNIWVSIDDVPKGIDVYNAADGDGRSLLADVVFLVDNSGSMSEEGDAVANSIIKWATQLAQSGLDLRVGCVGYGNSSHAIDGALNLTTPELLEEYLNYSYGTYRTEHYGGEDADELRSLATGGNYENGPYYECGMVALHFAHDNFNFRGGANRIYVNFTDEPNQPCGIQKWSVEYLNPETTVWKSSYGTIHTVYSENEHTYDSLLRTLYYENPWIMSEYTGGTYKFVDRYASSWDLTTLPVTGAMQNSSIIRLTNIEALNDNQPHKIKITVQSTDKKVRGEKVVMYNFSEGREE